MMNLVYLRMRLSSESRKSEEGPGAPCRFWPRLFTISRLSFGWSTSSNPLPSPPPRSLDLAASAWSARSLKGKIKYKFSTNKFLLRRSEKEILIKTFWIQNFIMLWQWWTLTMRLLGEIFGLDHYDISPARCFPVHSKRLSILRAQ